MTSTERHSVKRFKPDDISQAVGYFNEFGYVVFMDAFDPEVGEAFWRDVEIQIATNDRLTYSLWGQERTGKDVPLEGKKLPRIIDMESHSAIARELMLGPVIARFLTALYGQRPTCLQTLTYKYSSEQAAHSDKTLVAPPWAAGYDRDTLAASWIALEASDESNGALVIYPGSHLGGKRGFYDGFDKSYDKYTTWLSSWLAKNGYSAVSFYAQPGDILFWHGDFVHAGGPIRAKNEIPPTRKSLVCHYARMDSEAQSSDRRWAKTDLQRGAYFQKVLEKWPQKFEQRHKWWKLWA